MDSLECRGKGSGLSAVGHIGLLGMYAPPFLTRKTATKTLNNIQDTANHIITAARCRDADGNLGARKMREIWAIDNNPSEKARYDVREARIMKVKWTYIDR